MTDVKAGRFGRNFYPNRKSEGRLAFWLLLPAVVAVFGVIVYPIVRTVVTSVFDVQSVLAPSWSFIGFENYLHVFSDPGFWNSLGITLYFTFVSTFFELVFGLVVALLLNAPLKWRWLFRALVVLPWAFPTIVNAAMWKGLFNAQFGAVNALLEQLGIIHSYHAWLGDPFTALNIVVFADVWKNTSVAAIFLLAGLTTIPADIYEAAKIDRARSLRTFRSITLPLLVPSISIVLVLRTIEAFKVFDIIYAMTRGGPANGTETIAYYAYNTAFSDQQYGIGSAISCIIVVIILILSTIYLRTLRQGEASAL